MGWEFARGKTVFLRGMAQPDDVQAFLGAQTGMQGLAFIGRSNVGKSSLINALFGKGTARVSNTPGRTREINVFNFSLLQDGKPWEEKNFFLIDLPGHGHAEVPKAELRKWQELMHTFFTVTPPMVALVNMQDARHPAQKSDLLLLDYIKPFHFQQMLVFNKIDKLKTQKERAELKKLMPELSKKFKVAKQMHFVSAETRQGLPQLEEGLIQYLLKGLVTTEMLAKDPL